ncbi:hypothetical protein D1007_05576 [Hordeum vulgare]|nr:hypothetical protein D1007_05576 [Hordeum vulgare]
MRSKGEEMEFLISTIQGMGKNIKDILLNQKSLARIVETKFPHLDIKVTELTTTVYQLKRDVDVVPTPSYINDDDDGPSLQTST